MTRESVVRLVNAVTREKEVWREKRAMQVQRVNLDRQVRKEFLVWRV